MNYNRVNKGKKILGKNIKSTNNWKIGFIALIIICIAFLFSLKEYNRKQQSLLSVIANYETADTKLLYEFGSNEVQANKKYKGKVVLVNGFVKKIEKKGSSYTISLGDSVSPSSVIFSLDSLHNPTNIIENKKAKIKGLYVGFNHDELLGTDVIFTHSIFVN